MSKYFGSLFTSYLLLLLLIFSLYKIPVVKLTRDPHTVISLSIFGVSFSASFCWDFIIAKGSVPWRIANLFFIRPITHSIWILTCAICLVVSTSLGERWLFPLVKLGILSSAPQTAAKSSCKVNPRSAKIWSPGDDNLG